MKGAVPSEQRSQNQSQQNDHLGCRDETRPLSIRIADRAGFQGRFFISAGPATRSAGRPLLAIMLA